MKFIIACVLNLGFTGIAAAESIPVYDQVVPSQEKCELKIAEFGKKLGFRTYQYDETFYSLIKDNETVDHPGDLAGAAIYGNSICQIWILK